MDCFSGVCTAFGLTINVNKTLVMSQPAPNKHFVDLAIFVYGKHLKVVDPFVSLGSILSQDNSLNREISLRLLKATRCFVLLEKRVWSQCGIKISIKLGVYQVLCAHCPFVRLGDLDCIQAMFQDT